MEKTNSLTAAPSFKPKRGILRGLTREALLEKAAKKAESAANAEKDLIAKSYGSAAVNPPKPATLAEIDEARLRLGNINAMPR